MDKQTTDKKERLLGALDKGAVAQIHLDARQFGVLVPTRFRMQHQLVLNVSYRFDPPDLSVNDWGIRQTLQFSGERFNVAVPWSAVFAVISHTTKEVWMFPESMPVELTRGATDRATAAIPGLSHKEAPATPRAVLHEVVTEPEPSAARASDDASGASGSSTEPQSNTPPSPPKRGHLRLVK